VKDLTPENKFDDLVRGNLDGFEMPYDASAWARFESKLAPQAPTSTIGSSLLKGAAAALVIGGAALGTYLLWPSPTVNETLTETTQHDEMTSAVPEVNENGTPFSSEENDGKESKSSPTVGASEHAAPVKDKLQTASADGTESKADETKQSENKNPSNAGGAEQKGAESNKSSNQLQELLNLAIKMSRNSICVNEEVRFMAVTGTGGLEFEWHFSDGEKRTRTETARHFEEAGIYEVTLIASRGEQTWERTANIDVQPRPKADFELVRPILGIPLYDLNIALAEGDRCRWTFSDGRVSDEQNTRQLFRRRGDAGAELMVTNAFGCSSVAKRSAYISEDFRLLAPNTFSPNGDGTNDDFIPRALEVMDCDFEMLIRDVAGREIYRTTNVDSPWNGRENNTGNLLPAGLYIWTVVLKNSVLYDPVFRGEITLQP
jgi:hypothetical protein